MSRRPNNAAPASSSDAGTGINRAGLHATTYIFAVKLRYARRLLRFRLWELGAGDDFYYRFPFRRARFYATVYHAAE